MAPTNSIRGVVIGLMSAFGIAVFLAILIVLFYCVKFTSKGRIFLDGIRGPGEYDDEQAFAREEEEALETMDDMQRTEYLRAKGMAAQKHRVPFRGELSVVFHLARWLTTYFHHHSIHRGEPSRIHGHANITITIPGHSRKGRFGLGV